MAKILKLLPIFPFFLTSTILGINGVGRFPTDWVILVAVTALCWLVIWRRRIINSRDLQLCIAVCLILVLAGLYTGWLASQRFQPLQLDERKSYVLTGVVEGTPRQFKFGRSWTLKIQCLGDSKENCRYIRDSVGLWPLKASVMVTHSHWRPRPGEVWQLSVRARPASRVPQPWAFDISRWLLAQHLIAGFRLSDAAAPVRIAPAAWSMDHYRQQINQYFLNTGNPSSAPLPAQPVLLALITGDRTLMSDAHWHLFNATGTSHLVAISGLHIGLVTGFTTALALLFLRRWLWLTSRVPALHCAALVGLLFASCYAALAGFALPTQRALLMLVVYVLLMLLGRARQLWFSLVFTFCVVIIWDPMAVLSLGFWLSFMAVAFILWVLGGKVLIASRWQTWLNVQLGLFVGLMPFLLWQLQAASLISPLANLLAIPLIGLLVVPLVLFWALIWPLFGDIAAPLLTVAGVVLEWLFFLLQSLSAQNLAVWHIPEIPVVYFGLAIVGVVWALAPGVPGRWLAPLLVLPILVPNYRQPSAYLLADSSTPQLAINLPDRGVFIDQGRWPEPIPDRHQNMMAYWGVGLSGANIRLQGVANYWQSDSLLVTEYNYSDLPFRQRRVTGVRYYRPCYEDYQQGELIIQRLVAPQYPHHCALKIQYAGYSWLLWPTKSVRSQRYIVDHFKQRLHGDVLVVFPGAGEKLDEKIWRLWSENGGRVLPLRPLPDELLAQFHQLGVALEPLNEGRFQRYVGSAANGTL